MLAALSTFYKSDFLHSNCELMFLMYWVQSKAKSCVLFSNPQAFQISSLFSSVNLSGDLSELSC